MRVERISDIEQLSESVRSQWNRLPLPSPMQSPEWLLAWWQTFGCSSGNELCILLAFDENDSLVAVAPFYVAHAWSQNRSLRFLGDGAACSDHATILITAGLEQSATSSLSRWLFAHAGSVWDTLRLDAADSDDMIIKAVLESLANYGCDLNVRDAVGCWEVDLPSNWDEFLAGLSKNHRKRCRRWKRDYIDSGRIEVQNCPVDDVHAAWQVIAELNQQRREKMGDRSVFTNETFHQFHLAVLPMLLAAGKAELRLLSIDGEITAAEYLLVHDDTLFCYQSGMRTSDNRDGYGNLSILALFHDAISRGCQRIDFLRGDEDYKKHWGARRRACVHFHVASRSLRGAAAAACYRTVDWMRAVRKTFVGAPA